jgi:hypothetical protein
MMNSSARSYRALLEEASRRGLTIPASALQASECLLPAPYSADTADAAWAFVRDLCWSWDEASGVDRKIPDHPYLEEATRQWHATMKSGQPFVFEKSRRLVVSWLLCALDLWDALRRRCNIVQGGRDYAKASDFVWRCWYILGRIRRHRPDLGLPAGTTWGNPLSQKLDKFALPNGSIVEPLNSDGESFRGSGYTRVKLEELSSYRYVAQVWSQALAVTMGPPGMPGGHVVAVCNASTDADWQELKAHPEDEPAFAEPVAVYDARSGVRAMRIHYSADPSKGPDWVRVTKGKGWLPAEWDLEMELVDQAVAGALWDTSTIASCRAPEAPPGLVRIVVAVDPSVTDDVEGTKRKPDECGIVVAGVTEDSRLVIINDLSAIMPPDQWSRVAIGAANHYRAGVIAVEDNQGGALVGMALKTVAPSAYIERYTAKQGKRARAEPVALLYHQGRAVHVRRPDAPKNPLAQLEREMTTWDARDPSSPSPNRIDALVLAAHALGMANVFTSRKRSLKKKSGQVPPPT